MRVWLSGFLFLLIVHGGTASLAQTTASSSKHVRNPSATTVPTLDTGTVSNGVYHNPGFGFSYKIAGGWVLRTEEMNARDEEEPDPGDEQSASTPPAKANGQNRAMIDGRVLLAAFSRPPQAKGEDVNSSVLIAAESVAAYPGLKEAAQYFGPITEVAKGQGFAVENEPSESTVGEKSLVRSDFQKDVGSRVMRQSTLVMLAHGYAVSFTFIGGTEDEVEDLINGLNFAPTRKPAK